MIYVVLTDPWDRWDIFSLFGHVLQMSEGGLFFYPIANPLASPILLAGFNILLSIILA